MGHLRVGGAVNRFRSEAVRVPVIRTPGGLVKRLGRAVLWMLVVVLLLRGLASVLEPREPAAVVPPPRAAPAAWPDDDARAFAAQFARAYLSHSPKRPDAWARAVQAFATPELASSIVPEHEEREAPQDVEAVTIARTVTLDARHALVTVAATVDPSAPPRYLTVPVARDGAGGLVVSDLPSFAAAPRHAALAPPATEPVPHGERPAVEAVVSRFLEAFLAGDASGLEYLVPAGVRIAVPAQPHELIDVTALSLATRAEGDERVVLATVRAREAASEAEYALRYRLRLVRRDRWYVAAVNEATRKGG